MLKLPLPSSWVEWHAALTHFPITLIFMALFFDGMSLILRQVKLRETSLMMLALAVASLPFSLASGYFTGQGKRWPDVFDTHWQVAVFTSVVALLVLVWRLAARDRLPKIARVFVLLLTGVSAGAVGYTGHLGGELVFGGRTEDVPPPVASVDLGAEKIALAADKIGVAVGNVEVGVNKLGQAVEGQKKPVTPAPAPQPIVVPPMPVATVDPSPINRAAKTLEDIAMRFEKIADKLDGLAKTLSDKQPAPDGTPTPTAKPGTTPTVPAVPALDPKLIEKGAKVYAKEEYGCADCHKMNGVGGKKGPDLTFAGKLHGDVEWQIGHMKDPKKFVPGSKMPAYDDIPPDDLRALAVFLVSKK